MKVNPGKISLFNTSGIDIPVNQDEIEHIAQIVFSDENQNWDFLEIVFLDEKGIIEINSLHLNRDYVTDVITYHYQDENEPVEGTIYLCSQRIMEQSIELGTLQTEEFKRIIIHAILHLCGFDDATTDEKLLMTNKENHYLSRI